MGYRKLYRYSLHHEYLANMLLYVWAQVWAFLLMQYGYIEDIIPVNVARIPSSTKCYTVCYTLTLFWKLCSRLGKKLTTPTFQYVYFSFILLLIVWSWSSSKLHLRIQSVLPRKHKMSSLQKINWLMLFKEIIIVCTENHTRPINTKCRVTDC
jgi:hypothetical protein